MAVGDLITADFQYEWNQTLLVGSGTDYDVVEADGLDDLPTVDAFDIPRDARWGSDDGTDLARDRVATFSGELFTDTDAEMASLLDGLRDTLTVGPVGTLAWRHSGEEIRFVYARCRRRSIPVNHRRSVLSAVWAAQFVAVDPLVYSASQDTDSTTRTAEGSGFAVPVTPPFTLGASTSGSVRVTNAGSVAAPWTGRMEGPLTDPVITNLSTGERLAFTANGGLTLTSGEYVDMSSDGRSVLLAGTASRRSQLSLDSRWWLLPPGDTDIELSADSGTGTFTITWRSTWL